VAVTKVESRLHPDWLETTDDYNNREKKMKWCLSDGQPCSGSISGAGHLFQYVTNQLPRPTQPFILPGSVNEYQLWQGRQWQVWFIPLVDNAGCAGKTVGSLENVCHT